MHGLLDLAERHKPILDLLSEQLEEVSVVFERQLASDLPAVNALCRHIEQYRGKMLRPTLVLVSGLASAGEPCDGSVLSHHHRVVAAVAEMIHMATLVHDDVLDDAQVRRRGATVNHLRGNEAAVMLGDYLISNAFHLCSSLNDPAINFALGEVTNTLCAGELVQLQHRENYGIDEATYFEIVRRKTASLIGECCRLGASLTNADESIANGLKQFGMALGIAFQIQDDLLDITGDQDVVGKSLGQDLAKGKMTLPVILHLAHALPADRVRTLRAIERRDADAVRHELLHSGAVQHAARAAQRLVDQAKAELPNLPPSPARDLLATLADAVVQRRS